MYAAKSRRNSLQYMTNA